MKNALKKFQAFLLTIFGIFVPKTSGNTAQSFLRFKAKKRPFLSLLPISPCYTVESPPVYIGLEESPLPQHWQRGGGETQKSSKLKLKLSPAETEIPLLAGAEMACNMMDEDDKIRTVSPSRSAGDAFEWDESGFSMASSEADQVREQMFEAMRSG